MLKPNIRGYPKSHLRFTAAGWKVQGESDVRLEFRLPWLKSWPIRLEKAKGVEILFSRSGKVHIVRTYAPGRDLRTGGEPKESLLAHMQIKLLLAAAAFALASVAAITIGLQDTVPEKSQSAELLEQNPLRHTAERKNVVNQELGQTCGQVFEAPTIFIVAWLAGNGDARLVFSEEKLIQLGGVRSRLITVTCSNSLLNYRVTESQKGGEWHLSDVARLQP